MTIKDRTAHWKWEGKKNNNNWKGKGKNPRVDEALVIKNKILEMKTEVGTNSNISRKEKQQSWILMNCVLSL